MKLIFLWIIIGLISVASGVAVLTNVIDIKAQQMGVFFIPCEDNTENCTIINSDDIATNNFVTTREIDDHLVNDDSTKNSDDNILEIEGNGCPVSFWIAQSDNQNVTDSKSMWPPGYLPSDKFGSPAYFNSKLAGLDDLSLIDALNSSNNGIGKLVRQAAAALLNAAHPDIEYPLTITEVISSTNEAITLSDYSVSDTFAEFNHLGASALCP